MAFWINIYVCQLKKRQLSLGTVALPKRPIIQFKSVQQTRQQVQRAYCSNVYTVESIGSKWWSCCSFRSYHTFGGSPFSFCSSHNFARIYFGSAPFAQSKLSKKCACRQIGSQAGGYVRGQAVGQAGGRAGGHRELPQLSSRRKRGHCTVGKILYLL